MTKQNKEIAQRIMSLREDNGMSLEDMAANLGMSPEEYAVLETGEVDLPISMLETISHLFGIQFSILITGEEPKLRVYSITRKGEGTQVSRKSEYSYEALASNFQGKTMMPFEVTVPVCGDVPVATNGHDGHEFEYVLEGTISIIIDETVMTLKQGDSIYFDSTHKHGMTAVGGNALVLVMVDA